MELGKVSQDYTIVINIDFKHSIIKEYNCKEDFLEGSLTSAKQNKNSNIIYLHCWEMSQRLQPEVQS